MDSNETSKSVAHHPRDRKQYVLVVDDDKDLRDYLSQILELGGYRVTGAANGKIALQFLKGAPIDLVLSDLRMPEMDGIELTRKIAKHFPKLPVIIMSGSKTISEKFAGLSIPNVKKFLRKPVSIDALISAVLSVFTQPHA